MRTLFLNSGRAPLGASAVFSISVLLLSGAVTSFAQAPMAPMGQPAAPSGADQNKQLADQVTELRAQMARLQAAVQQTGPGKAASPKSGMKMAPPAGKGMGMMGEMPPAGSAPMAPGMSMGDDKDEMAGMPMPGKGAMPPAPAAAMGMCCMGAMGAAGSSPMSAMPPAAGGMANMSAPSSAMPGQAGASHLYHIGSDGFFLNHSQHISLTADQKMTLNRLKEKAMLDNASEQRRIEQSEQELYSLTGVDQLDASRVQAKVNEIEKLRGEQRMNFIRAVSDASNVLTHDQHLALLGTMAGPRK